MALAKAFPDTFIYEPHDPASVSWGFAEFISSIELKSLESL